MTPYSKAEEFAACACGDTAHQVAAIHYGRGASINCWVVRLACRSCRRFAVGAEGTITAAVANAAQQLAQVS